MDGKRIELSTGIFVLKLDWDEKAQVLIGRNEKIKTLNNRLDKFVPKINDAYNQLEPSGEAFDINSIKEKLIEVKPQNYLLQSLIKLSLPLN